MKLTNSLKFLVISVSVAFLASCSNMQPVSIDSNAKNITTAAISNLQINDMGWGGGPWGTGELWAVTKQSKGSDFYLARYNFGTSQWQVKTGNWGLKCAVSTHGKCYHVNAAGQIWWVKSDGSSDYINTPVRSSGSTKAKDIGAANYDDGTADNLFVACQTTSGNKYQYYGYYSGSGHDVEWILWEMGGSPARVAMDPDNGGETALCNSTGEVWWGEPETNRKIPNSTGFTDVGTCQRTYAAIKNSKLYIAKTAALPFNPTTITAKAAGMTTINGVIEVLFINGSDYLEYWPLSSF